VLARFTELESRLPPVSSPPRDGVMSAHPNQPPAEKGEQSSNDSELIHRESKFHFPRQDCPRFEGDSPVEWIRKCNSYFTLHQVPNQYKTHLATLQFQGLASEWYDGYLMDHDPPDWDRLVTLVHKRFVKVNAKSALEEWKDIHQIGTVIEYYGQFDKLRSRLLLERRKFSEVDYIDAFVGGLKGEIKSFVKLFKPVTIEEAFESALHVEDALESQSRKFKFASKSSPVVFPNNTKVTHEKSNFQLHKPLPIQPNKSLIEHRRALGQCFKCGERYFPGHQCRVKIQMLIGHGEEPLPQEVDSGPEVEGNQDSHNDELPEEAIVSMHATTNNPKVNTMRFKGYIGKTPITALIDSGSTHSFVNPAVLRNQACQLMDTHPHDSYGGQWRKNGDRFKVSSPFFLHSRNSFHW
jgi:Ty3 transposon capsid-like protein